MTASPERAPSLGQLSSPVRLVGLALLAWAVLSEMRPGLAGAHLAAWVFLVAVAPAWAVWSFNLAPSPRARALLALWMGVVGGGLAVLAPVALTFVGAASFIASLQFELPTAIGLVAAGPVSVLLAAVIHDSSASLVVGAVASALAGLVLGVSRRQMLEHAEQAALVALERERAELEHARSEVLDERNRLAREIHDVLAHTLGALSVQLEALDAPLRGRTTGVRGSERRAHATKSLASRRPRRGTRRAVQSLRDDAAPLEEQLAASVPAVAPRSRCRVTRGRSRRRRHWPSTAWHRSRSTNAIKHAPGAECPVRLGVRPPAASPLGRQRAGRRPARSAADWGPATDSRESGSGSGSSTETSVRVRPRSGWRRRGEAAGMRVLIADDQRVVRDGLATIVGSLAGMEVVGAAADGAEAVACPRSITPTSCSWTCACRTWTAPRRPRPSGPASRRPGGRAHHLRRRRVDLSPRSRRGRSAI